MMSQEQFVTFLADFKVSIEKSVENTVKTSVTEIGKDINEKIDIKIGNIDEGIKNLKGQLDESEAKQSAINKRIEMRLSKMEEDKRREYHKKMKSDTLCVQPNGRKTPSYQPSKNNVRNVKTPTVNSIRQRTPDPLAQSEDNQPPGRVNHPTPQSSPTMTRSNSWAEEVERETAGDNSETANGDRRRWTAGSTEHRCWTEGLRATVNPMENRNRNEQKL